MTNSKNSNNLTSGLAVERDQDGYVTLRTSRSGLLLTLNQAIALREWLVENVKEPKP
jgi:hypothetical protein